ncbi:MAG: hypothetical protein MK108_15070 [Mariniblastus sp.]|nr:hypothetical protein [Mariniblastus sp.]
MTDEPDTPPENDTGLSQELGQLFRLGSQIFRQANEQIEEHLSSRVENFRTNRIDSWQELYDQLIDEYGEHAVQWKDAALHTMEDQVARLGQGSHDDWLAFDSYPDVEAHFESLGMMVDETDIRQWVMQGKPWIHVREGKIFLDPHQPHYPTGSL